MGLMFFFDGSNKFLQLVDADFFFLYQVRDESQIGIPEIFSDSAFALALFVALPADSGFIEVKAGAEGAVLDESVFFEAFYYGRQGVEVRAGFRKSVKQLFHGAGPVLPQCNHNGPFFFSKCFHSFQDCLMFTSQINYIMSL